MEDFKRCTKGIWDITIPGISFDSEGASNYSKMFENMIEKYPRGKKGLDDFENIVSSIKEKGKNKQYDCIIGVSGGTDSSYLMYVAKKKYGLRPLAVTFDNGWSSDISVENIKRVTNALEIDLETYVVDYEEMKDILKSYMKASLPWIDCPTDLAIKSTLYRIADKFGVKYVLIGHDFRSEGAQPHEWSYGDSKQLEYIQNKFGTKKIKSFPNMSFIEQIIKGYVKKIKMVYPFFYLEYQKKEAQKFLIENYGWQYYGGHHHENIFTKFAIAYWQKKKHNIDKRIITLSAQVMSGEITRENALEQIMQPPYNPEQMEEDKLYTIKKLGLTVDEFEKIWKSPNKLLYDYPSHYSTLVKIAKIIKPLMKLVMPQLPSFFFQIEARKLNQSK
ncbi:MAG: N-acetyl sugar amidotransferase [Bacteroidales bacterium]|nr:N-acetyl sugar amidotransferase [Bacteroidales bacterium]